MSEVAARLPLASLGVTAGFRLDTRFAAIGPAQPTPEPDPELEPEAEPEDPVATAYAEGFAAGTAAAQAEAAEQARLEAEAREALALSFARLDRDMVEQLELRLRETVAALCETALAPLALDEAALMPRIKRAAAMLARTEDERVIRLHPHDMAFLSPELARDERVEPDGSVPPGTIRVEGAQGGGVEDGPEQWSRAIREELGLC
jgi:flagellar assembly protein FliH